MCHYGNPNCRDTSDDTHECRVPATVASDEPSRCVNCFRITGDLAGGCCANCRRDFPVYVPVWRRA